MKYAIEYKPRAQKQIRAITPIDQQRILNCVEMFSADRIGDIKKLTNFTPSFRLRVRNYRVLFEIEGDSIVVYQVLHRSSAYKKR